jgi:hypothetical protein
MGALRSRTLPHSRSSRFVFPLTSTLPPLYGSGTCLAAPQPATMPPVRQGSPRAWARCSGKGVTASTKRNPQRKTSTAGALMDRGRRKP